MLLTNTMTISGAFSVEEMEWQKNRFKVEDTHADLVCTITQRTDTE